MGTFSLPAGSGSEVQQVYMYWDVRDSQSYIKRFSLCIGGSLVANTSVELQWCYKIYLHIDYQWHSCSI